MKYYLILIVHCLLIWFVIMFFADHQFVPAGTGSKIRNLVLAALLLTIGYNLVSIYILKKASPESGLLYKTASASQTAAANFSTYTKPFRRELIVYSLVAAGLVVIGLVLIGMPGFFMLQVPVKLGLCTSITGDSAWPAAILLSILWPLCLPAGVLLKAWLNNHGYTSFSFAGPLLTLLIGLPLLTTFVYALSK